MIISKANSLRFYKKDDLMPNMNNTRSDIVFSGMLSYCFAHKFINTDQVPLEIAVTDASTITVIYNYILGGNTEILPYYNETIGTTTYYYYKINQQKSGYLTITDGAETWYSERIEIIKTIPPIKIEWFNFEDAFGFHYRDELVNFMRLNGVLKDYAPKGKSTIFDNQGEELKVKEVLYRQQKLIIEPVPAAIAEKLTIAAAHDLFVVNDVEYISDSLPTVKEMGFSNLYEVEFKLTEKFAIGINRHTNKYTPTPALYYADNVGDKYTDDLTNYYTD